MYFSDNSTDDLLPVVMFIHGETFEIGTGNAYDGSVLAAYGHVVVVTINYRMGVFGKCTSFSYGVLIKACILYSQYNDKFINSYP